MSIGSRKHSVSESKEEVPSMTMQCNAVRFLFVDEIEATGAETLGALEHNVIMHISSKGSMMT